MDLAHFQRHFFHLLKEESPELGSLHPFVAFNLMKNAARFERDELIEAIAHLAKTDREMKTSGGDHRLPLERFILSI
jgi:DNA polymerase III delta subunit